MSWFVRLDRFASAHMVRSQDANYGCGISSIAMVNFKMKVGLIANGMAPGQGSSVVPILGSFVGTTMASVNDAVRSEEEVRQVYQRVSGDNVDLNAMGADWSQYPAVLTALGLGNWFGVDTGGTGFVQAVADATNAGAPVIVVVSYPGGGEHAMVIDETHSWNGGQYLCVCDPWDGELRLLWGQGGHAAPAYDANQQPISLHLAATAARPGEVPLARSAPGSCGVGSEAIRLPECFGHVSISPCAAPIEPPIIVTVRKWPCRAFIRSRH